MLLVLLSIKHRLCVFLILCLTLVGGSIDMDWVLFICGCRGVFYCAFLHSGVYLLYPIMCAARRGGDISIVPSQYKLPVVEYSL